MSDLEFLRSMRRKVEDAGTRVFFTYEEAVRMHAIYPYMHCHWQYHICEPNDYAVSVSDARTFLNHAIDYEEERIAKAVTKQLEAYK